MVSLPLPMNISFDLCSMDSFGQRVCSPVNHKLIQESISYSIYWTYFFSSFKLQGLNLANKAMIIALLFTGFVKNSIFSSEGELSDERDLQTLPMPSGPCLLTWTSKSPEMCWCSLMTMSLLPTWISRSRQWTLIIPGRLSAIACICVPGTWQHSQVASYQKAMYSSISPFSVTTFGSSLQPWSTAIIFNIALICRIRYSM